MFVQRLAVVHCKGPDPVISPSPLALSTPTPRLEAPVVLWPPDSPPEGPVQIEATALGVLLGEGTSILWVLPARSRLLSGQEAGFKTSYMCKNEDIPYIHRVPRPFPNPARCFSWKDPFTHVNSGACFPRDVAQALLLDQHQEKSPRTWRNIFWVFACG